MRHINFFWGPKIGGFGRGAKKFMLKKFMCFFRPLIRGPRIAFFGELICWAVVSKNLVIKSRVSSSPALILSKKSGVSFAKIGQIGLGSATAGEKIV